MYREHKMRSGNRLSKLNKHAGTDGYFLAAARIMCAHPFLTGAVLCLMCTVLTTGEGWMLCVYPVLPGLIMLFCALAGTDHICRSSDLVFAKPFRTAAAASSVLLSAGLSFLVAVAEKPQLIILHTVIAACVCTSVYLLIMKLMTAKKAALMLMVSGFAMRLAYVMSITIKTKQHDAGNVEEMRGHVGYVAYLLFNGTLPQMDVRTVDQFYHPPLHHTIAALWVKLQTLFGISQAAAFENIQILTLFYSCACMIIAYKLFRKLGLRGAGLVCAEAVIAFCPTFFILSGSINNDILCITLMLAAVLNTLYWLEKRTLGRIMCVAVCVGCGMMTKLSGWMVAPAIAVIFLYGLAIDLKNDGVSSKQVKKYALQFGLFLPTSAVLGLWWGIRNLIRDGVPIAYIIRMSDKSDMYVGDIPVMQRIFSFDPKQFEDVATAFERYEVSYNEYNPLIGLIKTSDFDELFTAHFFPAVAGFDKLLFWSTVAVALTGFAAMVYCFIADRGMLFIQKLFLGTLYGVIFACYYAFCISFPHICTMNIRYAVPLIVIGAFFVGRIIMLSGNAKGRFAKAAKALSFVCTAEVAVYGLASYMFYINVFK